MLLLISVVFFSLLQVAAARASKREGVATVAVGDDPVAEGL